VSNEDREMIKELGKTFELLLQPKTKVRQKFKDATTDKLYHFAKIMRRMVAKTDDFNIHALIDERAEEIAELAEAEILTRSANDS